MRDIDMKRKWDAGFMLKKERECGISPPPPFPEEVSRSLEVSICKKCLFEHLRYLRTAISLRYLVNLNTFCVLKDSS